MKPGSRFRTQNLVFFNRREEGVLKENFESIHNHSAYARVEADKSELDTSDS